MAYQFDKTGSITITGFENGIGVSPHKGIANIQNANISTESGEVMCSFERVQQTSPTIVNGTLTQVTSSTVNATGGLTSGTWIIVTNGGTTSLSGVYYVMGSLLGNFALSTAFSTSISNAVSITAGTATFSILTTALSSGHSGVFQLPVASCTESYIDINKLQQFRYYILDAEGKVWVQDTSPSSTDGTIVNPLWFLPFNNTITQYGGGVTNVSGIGILNGWLFVFGGNGIFCKPTVNLQDSWSTTPFAQGTSMGLQNNQLIHYVLTSHSGFLYYTDGTFVGSIQPMNSVINSLGVNIQSFSEYTSTSSTGTINDIISGSLPASIAVGTPTRIPAEFFASSGGAVATSLNSGGGQYSTALFFIQYSPGTSNTFQVYSAISGGSALDITSGASGTQYFNTFYPSSSFGETTYVFAPQALRLPFFETAQCLAESSSNILVGCKSNVVYLWNQVSLTPNDLIPLPENNSTTMVNVNNMTYIFTGNRGNIYVTNGSTASLVTTVPDYCAGVPGSPNTYIEPYFIWGGAAYIRGRVYFSILDQTSSKSGNCGGIWSFVPTQNFYIGQDTGLSLRLENQNSYGTYNGVAPIILGSQVQSARSPQYWAAWESTNTGTTFGIDFTGTTPNSVAIIETDLIPTGTFTEKETYAKVEYKVASPLITNESVAINYRLNGADAWVACTNLQTESNGLSGYFMADFQNTQWVQLQVILTPVASSSASFNRVTQLTISK